MTSGNDGVPRGPNEGDERESGHPDGASCRSRPRIDDGDGAAVTFGSMFNVACMERNKMGSPANARTSPCECAPDPQRGWKIRRKRYRTEAFIPEYGCRSGNTTMNSSQDQL